MGFSEKHCSACGICRRTGHFPLRSRRPERGLRDRAFATGGEWKYTNIKWHLAFDFRYEREYGVELRTSGGIFVGGITFLNLLPPKKP